jgi:hypothetical protein
MNEHTFQTSISTDKQFVHKLTTSEQRSPAELAKSNFYMKHHMAVQKSKKEIEAACQRTCQQMHLNGIKQKPLKWIGTQRTAFTHRKKMKRIKEVIEKTKENL